MYTIPVKNDLSENSIHNSIVIRRAVLTNLLALFYILRA